MTSDYFFSFSVKCSSLEIVEYFRGSIYSLQEINHCPTSISKIVSAIVLAIDPILLLVFYFKENVPSRTYHFLKFSIQRKQMFYFL